MTLEQATLFPQSMLPLFIFEPRYRRMLADALSSHRMFCVAMRKPGSKRETPVRIAGVGLIRASVEHRDGTSHMILQGLERVRLGTVVSRRPYRVQRIHPLASSSVAESAVATQLATLRRLVRDRLKLSTVFPFAQDPTGASPAGKRRRPQSGPTIEEMVEYLNQITDPAQIADVIGAAMLADPIMRQTILELTDVKLRLNLLIRFLSAEIESVRNQNKAD